MVSSEDGVGDIQRTKTITPSGFKQRWSDLADLRQHDLSLRQKDGLNASGMHLVGHMA
jgi:hypothetical protein